MGHACDFSEKEQKNVGTKKGKISKNLGKNVQNLKIFLRKGRWLCAIIACNKLLEKALKGMGQKLKKKLKYIVMFGTFLRTGAC